LHVLTYLSDSVCMALLQSMFSFRRNIKHSKLNKDAAMSKLCR
jgi:hypothetical protein